MIRGSKALSGTGNTHLEASNGQCLFSDQFYCPCLLWKGHIMDNSWTFFLHSTLQHFCSSYSYISASPETPVPKYKDWVTLSAGSGYMVGFFFSSQASTALTAQSTPTPQKNTHTHYQLLFHTSKCEALPGLSTIANMALLPPPVNRQPSQPVLTAPLLIFILPLNFNHFVLHLSFIFHC